MGLVSYKVDGQKKRLLDDGGGGGGGRGEIEEENGTDLMVTPRRLCNGGTEWDLTPTRYRNGSYGCERYSD